MVRLIFNIIFLIILAVFIALNMSYKTDINLFTMKMEEISVVAVVLLSIVAGVLYSFLFYMTSYFGKLRKEKMHKRFDSAKKKEKELKDREKSIDQTVQQKVTEEKEKIGLNQKSVEKREKKPLKRVVPNFFNRTKSK